MSDRSTRSTTTHDWRTEVDRDHLAEVRRQLRLPGVAGGLRHLVLDVLAYADDEAESQGRRGRVPVTFHADGRVTVEDDGRGTDTRRDSDGRIIRKPVMATADVRFADPREAALTPRRSPRRGMSTVAALSSELVHDNHRKDGSWSQASRHGVPDEELAVIERHRGTGTSISLRSDVTGPTALTETDLTAFPSLRIDVI